MATTPRVLAQVRAEPDTDTLLLTVGSEKAYMVSTIAVCNLGDLATYRIAVRPNGELLSDRHYIVHDAALGANTTDFITVGIGLAAGTSVTVRASGPVAFGAYGAEVS